MNFTKETIDAAVNEYMNTSALPLSVVDCVAATRMGAIGFSNLLKAKIAAEEGRKHDPAS